VNDQQQQPPDTSLDLEDYLKGAGEASTRTRAVMVAMVVASVLALVSFLNTMNVDVPTLRGGKPSWLHLKSWKLARLERLGDPTNDYVKGKICADGPCLLYQESTSQAGASASPTPFSVKPPFVSEQTADWRYRQFYSAAARDYVENAFTVRVPFFGVAFDVNDLGLLVGIGFVAILLLLRFSIRSEIIGLRVSFKIVKSLTPRSRDALERFYDLLAMKQVFTLPRLNVTDLSVEHHGKHQWSSHEPNWSVWILRFIHKLICCLPFFVYTIVAWHDLKGTRSIGESIDPDHFTALIGYTFAFWVAIALLTSWCVWKLTEINFIWDSYRSEISNASPIGLHARYVKRVARRSQSKALKKSAAKVLPK